MAFFRNWIHTQYQVYLKATPERQEEMKKEVYDKLDELSKDESIVRDAFHRFTNAEAAVQAQVNSITSSPCLFTN